MKRQVLLAILGGSLLCGCADFIDQDNRSNVPQTEFYSTKEGFTSLINSGYSTLRAMYYGKDQDGKEGDPWLFEAGTDLFASGRTPVDNVGLLGDGYNNALESVSLFYNHCYQGISLANDAIYFGGQAADFSEKQQYIDEARFLRAYYYYLLVQQFGDVVLSTEHYTTSMPPTKRTAAADVYKFIIDEFTYLSGSESHLLDKASGADFGHADKRAAMHFLSKAYLTRGYESYADSKDFENAKAYADKVIAASDGLTLPFADVMDVDNEQCDEIIFSCIYSSASVADPSKDGSKQQAHYGTYLNGPEAGHKYTSSTLTPTLRMHEVFASSPSDERYDATFMKVLYKGYWDYYKGEADREKTDVFVYYPPSWEVADTAAWRAADPEHRKNAYIVPMTEKGNNYSDKGVKVTTYENKMTNDVYGVACFRKFDDKNSAGTFSQTCSMHDVYIARVSEAYLVAAEALIKMNRGGEAVDYVNKVRNRAKATPATASDMTIDYILDERAREFAGENLRWMDLKRTGKLKEYTVKYNPDIRDNGGESLYKGSDGNDKILRPIPLSAMELNDELTQNPGY